MPFAKTLAATLNRWSSADLKLLIVGLLGRLDFVDLAEVLACAHQRVHLAADKAREERMATGRAKRQKSGDR